MSTGACILAAEPKGLRLPVAVVLLVWAPVVLHCVAASAPLGPSCRLVQTCGDGGGAGDGAGDVCALGSYRALAERCPAVDVVRGGMACMGAIPALQSPSHGFALCRATPLRGWGRRCVPCISRTPHPNFMGANVMFCNSARSPSRPRYLPCLILHPSLFACWMVPQPLRSAALQSYSPPSLQSTPCLRGVHASWQQCVMLEVLTG